MHNAAYRIPLEYHVANRVGGSPIYKATFAERPPNQYLSRKGLMKLVEYFPSDKDRVFALIESGIDLSRIVDSAFGETFLLYFLISRSRLEMVEKLLLNDMTCPDGSVMTPFEWTLKIHPGMRFSDRGCLMAVLLHSMLEFDDIGVLDHVWMHRHKLNHIAADPIFVGDIFVASPGTVSGSLIVSVFPIQLLNILEFR